MLCFLCKSNAKGKLQGLKHCLLNRLVRLLFSSLLSMSFPLCVDAMIISCFCKSQTYHHDDAILHRQTSFIVSLFRNWARHQQWQGFVQPIKIQSLKLLFFFKLKCWINSWPWFGANSSASKHDFQYFQNSSHSPSLGCHIVTLALDWCSADLSVNEACFCVFFYIYTLFTLYL